MSQSIQILKENKQALESQYYWLERSYLICKKLANKNNYQPEEMDALETLCARFARSIDYLIRKVFRSIDDVEFENQGTLIDVVHNAEKRGLIESTEKMRLIKEIRNEIVHEYIQEEIQNHFSDVLINTEYVLKIIKNTIEYCRDKHGV